MKFLCTMLRQRTILHCLNLEYKFRTHTQLHYNFTKKFYLQRNNHTKEHKNSFSKNVA